MAEEIELKLELLPSDAEALAASALLCGDAGMIQQRSVYFDTPDQALSKAGLSLRIRRSGETCIQTVKAEGASAAGLYARSEWELPVEGEVPVLDYTTPIRTLLRDAVDAIVPIFEVQVERRTWIIDEDGATIELVLDRGEVVAGDRQSPICEAELELKRGEPAALFALARSIDALVAVRLGVQTKAERGYRLAGPAATVYKAKPVALAVNMTAAEAFQRIVQSCLQQFRLNEALLMAGRNAEALHQARVALRRLRSAIAIFKPLIRSDTSAALNTELRWLASELSDARNLDVLLERAKPGPLHEVIAAAREAAYDRAADALHSPRSRALMLDLAEWTATGDWLGSPDADTLRDQPAREFAVHALDRFRRKVKKGGRCIADVDDEARHEVRKDAKKLRYAAEFFKSLFERMRERRRFKRFVAALEELQDQLGALNDLATAMHVLNRLGVDNDPGAATLLAKGSKEALLDAAADAHHQWVDIKRYWR